MGLFKKIIDTLFGGGLDEGYDNVDRLLREEQELTEDIKRQKREMKHIANKHDYLNKDTFN